MKVLDQSEKELRNKKKIPIIKAQNLFRIAFNVRFNNGNDKKEIVNMD